MLIRYVCKVFESPLWMVLSDTRGDFTNYRILLCATNNIRKPKNEVTLASRCSHAVAGFAFIRLRRILNQVDLHNDWKPFILRNSFRLCNCPLAAPFVSYPCRPREFLYF